MACSYLNFYKYFLHFEFLPRNTIKNESIHLNSWYHSDNKQKDSLETRVVLLIFSLELEILNIWGSRKDNTSKPRKMVAFVRNCLVKMTLRLFQLISVVVTMLRTLLRQNRRSLQIKKITINAPRLLQFSEQPLINNKEKGLVTRTPPTQLKMLQQLYRKRSNNWPKVSFIQNGSEITTRMEHSFKTKSTKYNTLFSR